MNYEVFEIISEDYHSELYSKLHLRFLEANPEEKSSIKNFDTRFFIQEKKLEQIYPEKKKKNQVTLCTYVRNYIHHRAECDYDISEIELKESIDLMREFLLES